jgi:hypothetical protein
MMSSMEPTTTSQPPSEPTRTDASNTFKTAGAPSDRHFEQMILPSIGIGFPRGLIRHLRNRFKRNTIAS